MSLPCTEVFVTEGAVFKCNKGQFPAILKINHDGACIGENNGHIARDTDIEADINLPSCGLCQASKNKGNPCKAKIVEIKYSYLSNLKVSILGGEYQRSCLGKKVKLICEQGGKITFLTTGQIPLRKDVKEILENYQKYNGYLESIKEVEKENLDLLNNFEGFFIPSIETPYFKFDGASIINASYLAKLEYDISQKEKKLDTLILSGEKKILEQEIERLKALKETQLEISTDNTYKTLFGNTLGKNIPDKFMNVYDKFSGINGTINSIAKVKDVALKDPMLLEAYLNVSENGSSLLDMCFTPNTKVLVMGDVLIKISEIKVLDFLISSFNNNKIESKVIMITTNDVFDTIKINLENEEIIECTPTHPFYTNEGWVISKDLNKNHKIKTVDGSYVSIVKKEFIKYTESIKVYNLRLENNIDNYFVGENKIMVYSGCNI